MSWSGRHSPTTSASPTSAICAQLHGFGPELAEGLAATRRGDLAAAARAIPDEMVEAFALVGTAASVREQLAAYEGLIDWPLLAVPLGHSPTVTHAQVERIIDCFTATRS